MNTYIIATTLVRHNNKFLIAKRAQHKEFAPNKWEFISGFIEEKEPAEETIIRELQEETALVGTIIKSGKPYVIKDKEARWIIIPFLIETTNANFIINKQDHAELKWITNDELGNCSDLSLDIKELKKQGLLT